MKQSVKRWTNWHMKITLTRWRRPNSPSLHQIGALNLTVQEKTVRWPLDPIIALQLHWKILSTENRRNINSRSHHKFKTEGEATWNSQNHTEKEPESIRKLGGDSGHHLPLQTGGRAINGTRIFFFLSLLQVVISFTVDEIHFGRRGVLTGYTSTRVFSHAIPCMNMCNLIAWLKVVLCQRADHGNMIHVCAWAFVLVAWLSFLLFVSLFFIFDHFLDTCFPLDFAGSGDSCADHTKRGIWLCGHIHTSCRLWAQRSTISATWIPMLTWLVRLQPWRWRYGIPPRIDDEHIRKALTSSLTIQEQEAEANLRQACHSDDESSFPGAPSILARTERPAAWRVRFSQKRTSSLVSHDNNPQPNFWHTHGISWERFFCQFRCTFFDTSFRNSSTHGIILRREMSQSKQARWDPWPLVTTVFSSRTVYSERTE